MAARLDGVVEVRFLLGYGNVNPHREERFDSDVFFYLIRAYKER
jgi:hypothetical protein